MKTIKNNYTKLKTKLTSKHNMFKEFQTMQLNLNKEFTRLEKMNFL